MSSARVSRDLTPRPPPRLSRLIAKPSQRAIKRIQDGRRERRAVLFCCLSQLWNEAEEHGFALFPFRPDTPTIRPLAVRQQRRSNLSAPPKQPLPICFPFIRRPPCGGPPADP